MVTGYSTLVGEIDTFVRAATASNALSGAEIRRILRFVNQVVEVVEASFRDVLGLLIEIKLLTPAALGTSQILELRKAVELLTARSQFRDALEICSRLRHLNSHFREFIEPAANQLPDPAQWHNVYRLLDEHEGAVIGLIRNSAEEMSDLLAQAAPSNLATINATAAKRADELRQQLEALHDLTGRILGLSGSAGFIELTEQRGELNREVNIYMDNRDQSNTQGHRVVIGPGSHVDQLIVANTIENSFNQASAASDPQLKKLLEELCKEVEKILPRVPPETRAQVQKDLGSLVSEATSAKPRKRWYELSGEGLIEAAKACGEMAAPVVTAVRAILPLLAGV